MDKQVKYLPLNHKKLDNFTLNALKKIAIAKKNIQKDADEINFQKWLQYDDNLFKVKYFITKLEDTLSKHNRRIVNEKGFKNMIASILYHNSNNGIC